MQCVTYAQCNFAISETLWTGHPGSRSFVLGGPVLAAANSICFVAHTAFLTPKSIFVVLSFEPCACSSTYWTGETSSKMQICTFCSSACLVQADWK